MGAGASNSSSVRESSSTNASAAARTSAAAVAMQRNHNQSRPDNRCCCFTLDQGAKIVAFLNLFLNLTLFSWYWSTSNRTKYGPLFFFELYFKILFVIARICDVFLLITIYKRYQMSALVWLAICTLEMLSKLVSMVLILASAGFENGIFGVLWTFFGYVGVQFFFFLIIYQYRKNLLEEQMHESTANPPPTSGAYCTHGGESAPSAPPMMTGGAGEGSHGGNYCTGAGGGGDIFRAKGHDTPPPSYEEAMSLGPQQARGAPTSGPPAMDIKITMETAMKENSPQSLQEALK